MGTYNESSKYEKKQDENTSSSKKTVNGSEFKNLTSPQTIQNQTKTKRPTGSK
jgi:hypothetical protein